MPAFIDNITRRLDGGCLVMPLVSDDVPDEALLDSWVKAARVAGWPAILVEAVEADLRPGDYQYHATILARLSDEPETYPYTK